MELMGVLGLTFWALWCIRKLFALSYKPERRSFWTTTSVVIPVYDESSWVVHRCIESIEANNPTEIIVVFNGEFRHQERSERKHPRVKFLYLKEADKRKAMALGTREATGKIVIFVDSDVQWEKDTLTELIKPFIDPSIGGVSTNQIIDNENVSIWSTLGSWLTTMGLNTGTPFQSAKKCVSCLRGRTAAYRKEMVLSFLEDFKDEIFLGRRCKSGDDGRLTFLTLRAGYGTVYQATSIVHTTMPVTMEKFLKHRLRCNRNTFRRYFSSITQRWFWRQNWRFLIELPASVIIPLGFINCVANFLAALWRQDWLYVILIFGWFCLGRSLRGAGWIKEKPSRLLTMPLMVISFLFLLTTVRWYALFTMNEQGWLTRGGVKSPEIRRHSLAASAAVALTMLLFLAYHSGLNLADNRPPISQTLAASTITSNIVVADETTKTTPVVETSPTSTPTPRSQPVIGTELLVGAFLPNFPPERNLEGFENQVGRRLDIISWFQNWDQEPITNKLGISCRRGVIPLITWESWSGRIDGGYPYPLAEIAEGQYDQLIQDQLRLIGQTCTGTILIRFDHEMNTPQGEVDWYPWQGDPESYVAAWQHVVNIGRQVAPNIKWVWAPAWGNEDAILYWPGDEYVDYVGLTVLNFWRKELDLRINWWKWRSFAELYEPQRPYLLAFQKPIIIAEVATGEGPAPNDKANWIRQMFEDIQNNYPEIAVVAWFNAPHAREFTDILWSVDSSPQSLEAFRNALGTKQTE